MMFLQWKKLAALDAAAAVDLVNRSLDPKMPRGGIVSVADLPFYDGGKIYQFVRAVNEDAHAAAFVLHARGKEPVHLDFRSETVYRANSEIGLKLDEATILPYLTFFFAAVHNSIGKASIIIEAAGAAPDAQTALAEVTQLCPPRLIEATPYGFRLRAAMYYAREVYKADLEITRPGGEVSVTSHQKIMSLR